MTTPKYLHCNSKNSALCGAYAPNALEQGCRYRSQCSIYLEKVAGQVKRQLGRNIQDMLMQDELDRLADEGLERCRR